MKTLDQIKDYVANKEKFTATGQGWCYTDWNELRTDCIRRGWWDELDGYIDEVAELYAEQFKPVWNSIETDIIEDGAEILVTDGKVILSGFYTTIGDHFCSESKGANGVRQEFYGLEEFTHWMYRKDLCLPAAAPEK